ncbi:MAG: NAD-dependent epimerase/dehydratase family protein [Aridibacter famidurans]|nr:NAD-dependent epimerase/dehydratase family protein [Aridibacter famidurans]
MFKEKRIFVTGATGFVGKNLVERLVEDGYKDIVCLTRSKSDSASAPGVTWVEGDLLDPPGYAEWMQDASAVLHLAAATGNASSKEHHRVNLEGTRVLIRACSDAGVERFVFVSTIAAGFPDISNYPYAQSKKKAEKVVLESGLDATVVRPTMVMGKGSKIGEALGKLVTLPLVPVIGKGDVKVQPIHVRDAADLIIEAALSDRTIAKVVEIGGPEVLSWNDWLRRSKQIRTGKNARLIHLPAFAILPVLRALESVLDGRLPVTSGQLSSFLCEGTASSEYDFGKAANEMVSFETMIRETV